MKSDKEIYCNNNMTKTNNFGKLTRCAETRERKLASIFRFCMVDIVTIFEFIFFCLWLRDVTIM